MRACSAVAPVKANKSIAKDTFPAIAGGIDKNKRKPHRKEHFVNQVHPDTGISSTAMNIINSFECLAGEAVLAEDPDYGPAFTTSFESNQTIGPFQGQ